MTRRNLLLSFVGVTGAFVVNSMAQENSLVQKSAASKPQDRDKDKLVIANNDVRELLLLMDVDNNGKISKKEWMSFMEAEFNQLDKDGNGELDPKELAQSRLLVHRDDVRHDNSVTVSR